MAGLEPAKPFGRLIEGQAALSICIHPPEVCGRTGRGGPTRTGIVPSKGHGVGARCIAFMLRPQECARRESNSHCAGFKPAASAVWATRAGRKVREVRLELTTSAF